MEIASGKELTAQLVTGLGGETGTLKHRWSDCRVNRGRHFGRCPADCFLVMRNMDGFNNKRGQLEKNVEQMQLDNMK